MISVFVIFGCESGKGCFLAFVEQFFSFMWKNAFKMRGMGNIQVTKGTIYMQIHTMTDIRLLHKAYVIDYLISANQHMAPFSANIVNLGNIYLHSMLHSTAKKNIWCSSQSFPTTGQEGDNLKEQDIIG